MVLFYMNIYLFLFDAGDQTINQQDYTLKTCNVAMVPELFFHSGYGEITIVAFLQSVLWNLLNVLKTFGMFRSIEIFQV